MGELKLSRDQIVALGLTTADEVLEVASCFYPASHLSPKSSFFVQQIFGPRTLQ